MNANRSSSSELGRLSVCFTFEDIFLRLLRFREAAGCKEKVLREARMKEEDMYS